MCMKPIAVDRSANQEPNESWAKEQERESGYRATVEQMPRKPSPRQNNRRRTSPRTAQRRSKAKHTITHTYHDRCTCHIPNATDKIRSRGEVQAKQGAITTMGSRGGVTIPFPVKLHIMLSRAKIEMFDHIVSWQPHGRCFKVHDTKQFISTIMPRFFKQSKITSFQRQLNLYGFARLTTRSDRGGYFHEMFLRRHVELCHNMIRTRVKGTGVKSATSPETEPDFSAMAPCLELHEISSGENVVNWPDFQSSECGLMMSTEHNATNQPVHIHAISAGDPFMPHFVADGADTFVCETAKLEPASYSTPLIPHFEGRYDESAAPRVYFPMSDEFEGKRFHAVDPSYYEW